MADTIINYKSCSKNLSVTDLRLRERLLTRQVLLLVHLDYFRFADHPGATGKASNRP